MLEGTHGNFLPGGLAGIVCVNVEDGRGSVEYRRLVGECGEQRAALGLSVDFSLEVGATIALKLTLAFAWLECRAGSASFECGDMVAQP